MIKENCSTCDDFIVCYQEDKNKVDPPKENCPYWTASLHAVEKEMEERNIKTPKDQMKFINEQQKYEREREKRLKQIP